MKYFLLTLSFIVVGCSSNKVHDTPSIPLDKISGESFKKEKPLSAGEMKDFYASLPKGQNPALQDETLDRYTAEELEKLADTKDPLLELSFRCAKKDFNNAFAVASKAYNKYQKIPAYWNQVANCHLAQGSPRKALLFYNKAIEVSPGYVPALNNIGVLYSRQGEDQKALLAFEKANRQSRFAKTPRYNLARLYLTYGMAEQALALFQSLLNESSEDVDLLNAVGSCYFILSDYQRAFNFYQKIPSALWENAEIGLNVAVTLKKMGKFEDAKKIYSNIQKPKDQRLKDYYASVGNHLGGRP